jgi:hypothetical protein
MNSPRQREAPRNLLQGSPDADLARGDLVRRIRAEFEEMPGLSLTSIQASKLFGISLDVWAGILVDLIEEGMLRLNSDGRYARRSTQR